METLLIQGTPAFTVEQHKELEDICIQYNMKDYSMTRNTIQNLPLTEASRKVIRKLALQLA